MLAKLIGLGMKGWSAIETTGFDEKDVAALQTLLETTTSFASMRKPIARTVAAQHLALVVRSFGQAVGRHQQFHGKVLLTGGLRRWLNRSERERDHELKLRVQAAALHLPELGNDPRHEVDLVGALTGSPLDTSYYRKLWHAFSDPGMTLPDEEPPLEMSQTSRREFERYFLLAYLAALESPAGRGVAEYLDNLQHYRSVLVRDLLVQDMAAWGGRHIFGNVPRERWTDGEPVPFLPSDTLYVESDGTLELTLGQLGDPEPILALIERLTAINSPTRVVLVVADFGSGKSLSARMLAKRWAERALAATSVSLDAVLPIYARCAEDFPHEAVDLAATVRRAWKRQADGFGLSISDDDAALAWPDKAQRMVCLLDGLDEVSLGEQHMKTLFQKLRDKATVQHRFVVFSRPGAVPARTALGDGVAIVHIQPFHPDQVERWIAGWNQLRPDALPVTLAKIEALGLSDLVRTPILLFMIAFTWEGYTARSEPPSRAEIYESFFVQIAAGKAAADKERHGPIAAASEALLAALKNQGVLEERAELPDAMLWLMARVAWEAQMLEQRRPQEALTRRHVDNLLKDGDLRLPDDAAHAIQIGLVLALQSDLRGADHQILFGHQSFREFLVGRHWAALVHQIVRGSQRDWDDRTAALLGGRLVGEQNKSLDFLLQIINAKVDPHRPTSPFAWTDQDREVVVRWAQDVFLDEGQTFVKRDRGGLRGDLRLRGEARLRDDTRAVLREAALAIGSLVRDSPGMRVADLLTLRSMLAWFWLHHIEPLVIAPEAHLEGISLIGVRLANAWLDRARLDYAYLTDIRLDRVSLIGARLVGTYLMGASLYSVNLTGADLTRAALSGILFMDGILDEARLQDADLQSAKLVRTSLVAADLHLADLRNATLMSSKLDRANLENANLANSSLDNASLAGANLRYARLINASLEDARLTEANLDHADLERARLWKADLEHAILTDANLKHAKLTGAYLDGADLTMANLAGADLTKASLVGAQLDGARYDECTTWPEDFDPLARGARLLFDESDLDGDLD